MRLYVGITNNVKKRWREHQREARRGATHDLYQALREHPSAYFVEVERGSREHIAQREIECIASMPRAHLFNRSRGGDGAGMLGLKHTDETRAKMSIAGKGRKQSPEHVANLAASRKGQTRSEESRARMSEGQKRRIRTPEEIERMRTAAVGRVVTDEHRAKLSAAATARWARARP